MIKKLLYKILEPRHFWRDVGFSELNELYVSNLLRRLSISVLMIFVPIYLYKEGHGVATIFYMYGIFFVAKLFCDFLAGYTVAYYGPKHTMIIAAVLQVIISALFVTVPGNHWPVELIGVIWGASASFYFIPFHVEFSKIKHKKHSGSEIGYMNVVERVAAALGPAIGGVLAVFFGSPSIFVAGTLLAFISLWPLFQSAEPVKTRQHLDFGTFPLVRAKYDILSYVALSVENTICINLWPFYVGLFVLTSSVYVQLGVMSSVAVLASVYTAHLAGKLLDKHSGVRMLRLSAVINTGIHFARPFIQTIWPAYAVSVANEVITNGYRIPFVKGFYSAADEYPGYRIVYIVTMEAMGSITKGITWFMLALLVMGFGSRNTMNVAFIIAGIASLLITLERFKAIRGESKITV